MESATDAWLCNEGYKERNGQCEFITDPRVAAIKAIYIQEVLAKSDTPREDSHISTQQEGIYTQIMNNKVFILLAAIIISVIGIGIGIFIYKTKR